MLHTQTKPATEVHQVAFERNRYTGMWRATCSCGWLWSGPQDEVQIRASTHDLEWEPVAVPA